MRGAALTWAAALALAVAAPARAQDEAPLRLDRGRFTAVFYKRDDRLVRALLDEATRADTFPGLPRPNARVLLAVAPDSPRFRLWIGPHAPEWGAAIAFPEQQRIVMQGSAAGSDAGDPREVLRHELAHLALHEALGDLPPRWFDEGYASLAAAEWGREEVLATNVALAVRGVPGLAALDSGFFAGAGQAQSSYALAYRAVAELASLDPRRGLALYFQYWEQTGSMDRAVRAAYGITLVEFEALFQKRTQRRYGVLALVGDLTVIGVLFSALLLPLYISRRRRDRKRLAAMIEADRVAEARMETSVIEELLRTLPPIAPPPASASAASAASGEPAEPAGGAPGDSAHEPDEIDDDDRGGKT